MSNISVSAPVPSIISAKLLTVAVVSTVILATATIGGGVLTYNRVKPDPKEVNKTTPVSTRIEDKSLPGSNSKNDPGSTSTSKSGISRTKFNQAGSPFSFTYLSDWQFEQKVGCGGPLISPDIVGERQSYVVFCGPNDIIGRTASVIKEYTDNPSYQVLEQKEIYLPGNYPAVQLKIKDQENKVSLIVITDTIPDLTTPEPDSNDWTFSAVTEANMTDQARQDFFVEFANILASIEIIYED